MRKPPRNLLPMETAPKDGAIIDLWSPKYGWVRDVWNDPEYPEPDGWVTICPRPFIGWRPSSWEVA